jgi:hypothetical protein
MDQATLNFNKSKAVAFLDIEKIFFITWHPGLLYELHKLKFSTNLIKLNSSFLSERKFTVSLYGEMSTSRGIKAGVPQSSFLSPTLYSDYM